MRKLERHFGLTVDKLRTYPLLIDLLRRWAFSISSRSAPVLFLTCLELVNAAFYKINIFLIFLAKHWTLVLDLLTI